MRWIHFVLATGSARSIIIVALILWILVSCTSTKTGSRADPNGFDAGFLAEIRGRTTQTENTTKAESYCGLYAVCRSLHILGDESPFMDLLDSKYISSKQGSTAEELILAVTDHQLQATAVTRCSIFMLTCLEPIRLTPSVCK